MVQEDFDIMWHFIFLQYLNVKTRQFAELAFFQWSAILYINDIRKYEHIMMTRDEILRKIRTQINLNGHIIGAVAGAGMTANYAVKGGADFLLALSAGKYRVMGKSSLASYFCYANSNDVVMKLGKEELLPAIAHTPVLFGLFAGDPFIDLARYMAEIKASGFSGIVNFPTVSLIDGQFREALEEEGSSYAAEVKAIETAHSLDLFTVAFVTNEEEAVQMIKAGADIICVHLGLTKGGFLGAKKYVSIDEARKLADSVFKICDELHSDSIKMVYAGPANTPLDMQYLYQNTACQGYIGGSTFDRIPIETAIFNTTQSFKSYDSFEKNELIDKLIEGNGSSSDYAEFVTSYIEEHYMKEVHLRDLALITHVSDSYLSVRFKEEVGISFTEYLVRFRVNKAKELLAKQNLSCKQVAAVVGYSDYAQFSKIFKKYVKSTPSEYKKRHAHS